LMMICMLLLIDGALRLDLGERLNIDRLGGIALADDGSLCLLDADTHQLFLLDATGNLLARRGGKGSGPGEMANAVPPVWSPTEKLFFAYDDGTGKLIRLTAEKFAETRLEGLTGQVVALRDQTVFSVDLSSRRGIASTLHGYDLQTGTSRIIVTFPPPERDLGIAGTGNTRQFFPWDPWPRIACDGRMLAFHDPATRVVCVTPLEQNAVEKRQLELRFQPLGDADFARFPARMTGTIRAAYAGKNKPLVDRIWFAGQGRLFVVGQREAEGHPVEVFDGTTRRRGVVHRLPTLIASDRVVFLDRDAGDALILEVIPIAQFDQTL